MNEDADTGLDVVATREIKKLYFVLLRIVEEDVFMEEEELSLHARRLHRVFLTSSKLYIKGTHTAQELLNDFHHLFNKLIEASLAEEMYEKTANLTRVRILFTQACEQEVPEVALLA